MIVLDMALILMKRRLDPIRIDPNLEEPFYASSKAEILRLLNFSGLLSTLLTIRELNDEIIELLAPYSEIKDLSEKARKAYKDLATLKTWTDKIQSYHAINKEVIPIKDRVQKAENSLRKASRKLARAERELERTEIGLAKCQHDFDSAMETKKVFLAIESTDLPLSYLGISSRL
jgi:DNA repair exonuclease SbcCD ATPase subunit